LIRDGVLGEIVLVRGEWHTAYPAWKNWRADPARSGSDVLGAVGVHVFDLLNYLLEADAESIEARVNRDPRSGLDSTIAAVIGYDNGTTGAVTITNRARSLVNSVHVLGTKGSAVGVGTLGMAPTGRLDLVIDGKEERRELPVVDLSAVQFEAFSRACATGETPNASGTDGLNSIALTRRILVAKK
ncbi:MAG: Gfo/Idh/MocA family oxidoreductase, partial [Hyphomicrobiales bacterium]|nr:Gfo/Idh/MocA family oxidoreductase [Hyphomicrobiales bacterium]